MTSAEPKKEYGLIKTKPKAPAGLKPCVFGDDSSGDEKPGAGTGDWCKAALKAAATGSMQAAQTRKVIRKAVLEDSTVYQYDEVYDSMQQGKQQGAVATSAGPVPKKARYMARLMETAERRRQEQDRRTERQVQLERDKEGDEFADKESFVTEAYKQKLLERQQHDEEEKRRRLLEDRVDVTKQKDLTGFYRHMLMQQSNADVKQEPGDAEKSDDADRGRPDASESTGSPELAPVAFNKGTKSKTDRSMYRRRQDDASSDCSPDRDASKGRSRSPRVSKRRSASPRGSSQRRTPDQRSRRHKSDQWRRNDADGHSPGSAGRRTRDDDIAGRRTREVDVSRRRTRDDDVAGRRTRDDDVAGRRTRDDDVAGRRTRDDDVAGRKTRDDDVAGRRTRDNDGAGRSGRGSSPSAPHRSQHAGDDVRRSNSNRSDSRPGRSDRDRSRREPTPTKRNKPSERSQTDQARHQSHLCNDQERAKRRKLMFTKRTVDSVFDAARERYFERVAARVSMTSAQG